MCLCAVFYPDRPCNFITYEFMLLTIHIHSSCPMNANRCQYDKVDNHLHKYSIYNCTISHWSKYSFCWYEANQLSFNASTIYDDRHVCHFTWFSVCGAHKPTVTEIASVWHDRYRCFVNGEHFVSFRCARTAGNMASIFSHTD